MPGPQANNLPQVIRSAKHSSGHIVIQPSQSRYAIQGRVLESQIKSTLSRLPWLKAYQHPKALASAECPLGIWSFSTPIQVYHLMEGPCILDLNQYPPTHQGHTPITNPKLYAKPGPHCDTWFIYNTASKVHGCQHVIVNFFLIYD